MPRVRGPRHAPRRRPTANAGAVGSGRASSRPRVAIFADSTSGWSNGLMPRMRPAIAVAYSQTMNCAPSEPLTRISPSWRSRRWNSFASSTRRTICRSAGRVLELGRDGQEHDGQDAGAVLAGGLGDELLDPVGQADDVRAVGDRGRACRARRAASAGDGGGEDERRVLGAVDRDLEERRLGLVEQLADVDTGEAGGHQAEGGQGRVAAADGRDRR